MRKLLITGTETGVGKTLVACAVAYAAHARGMRVGVMKPVETGCAIVRGAMLPADAQALKFAAASEHPLESICPFRYQSPLAPAAAAEVDHLPPPDIDEIVRCYRKIADGSEIMIVECAGGLAVPITWHKNYSDLARILELDTVIVVPNRTGSLNSAMLTFDYAQGRGIPIAGYIVNDVDGRSMETSSSGHSSLRRMTEVAYLGHIRFKEPVRRSIIEALLGA